MGLKSRASGKITPIQARAKIIDSYLESLFPTVPIPLDHSVDFTLLVAVLLSAQCTDERVNKTTPFLFQVADTPEKMSKLEVEKVREIIKPCGLSPQKSKALVELSKIIVERHGGQVPSNFGDLEALPGVGHKTASVVMAQAFGVPAFPVDTHIHRMAQIWKLTSGKNVKTTEQDLKNHFPKPRWNKLHLQIIYYGRTKCRARKCQGIHCPLYKTLFPKSKTQPKYKKS